MIPLPEGSGASAEVTHEDRNAVILRRTLSAISWIYGLWTGLFAGLALSLPQRTRGLYDVRLLLFHAAILGAAGVWLWKPRRGAWIVTLLAAAGALFFAGVDLHRGQPETAFFDGAYAPLAAVLLFKSRATS